MDRGVAAEKVAELFEDGGRTVLAEGGAVLDWPTALAPMPDAIFSVKSETPGLTVLTLARDLWSQANHLQMATAVTRGLITWHGTHHGEEHPETLAEVGALGALAMRAGRHEQAGPLLKRAYMGLRSVVGGRDLRLSIVAGNYGLHLAQQGHLEAAEPVLSQAYKTRKRLQPDAIAVVAGQLGEVLVLLGRHAEGLDCLRDAWVGHLDKGGAEHPSTRRAALNLATTLSRVGKHREAVPMWRELLVVAESSGHSERIAEMRFRLGVALYRSHWQEEGIRCIDEALRYTRTQSSGLPHAELPDRLTVWAELQLDAGRAYEAEGLLREAAEAQSRLTGGASVETAQRYVVLGNLLSQLGQLQEGLGYLESAASVLVSELGAQDQSTQDALSLAAQSFSRAIQAAADQGDMGTATHLVHHARDLIGPVLGFDHPEMLGLRRRAADLRIKI